MIEDALNHARAVSPEESCGLVIVYRGRERYLACKNVARDRKNNFEISAEDYVKAESLGAIVAVVHSHPYAKPDPSDADVAGCERSGLRWIILNPNTSEVCELLPTGQPIKLYGRSYHHGVSDCYSFAIDYYQQECGIILADYPREEEWWTKGKNMYHDYFMDVGFREIPMASVRLHDALLMTIDSTVMNHGAVYLGNNMIGHHLCRRISSRDVYGQFYRERTRMALRHKDLF